MKNELSIGEAMVKLGHFLKSEKAVLLRKSEWENLKSFLKDKIPEDLKDELRRIEVNEIEIDYDWG